jgi:integrase
MAGHITKRERDDGRITWRARYPDPTKGGTAQIERTFQRKQDAEAWLTDQRHAVKHGAHIAPRDGARLLANVADEWRSTWTDLEPKTTQGYESILSQHILPKWGKTKVAAITTDALQRWENDLASTRQPNTILHIHSVMRAVLDLGQARRYIGTNPADSIKLPSKGSRTKGRERQLYLTADELRKLVNATPEHWRLPTLVAALCGLRAGELWGLTRHDIDPLHGTMAVRYALKDISGKLEAGPTKTHAKRKLTIPAPLIPELTQALAHRGVKVRAVSRKPSPAKSGGYPCIVEGELGWTNDPANHNRLLFTTPGGTPVQQTNFYERVYRPTVVKLWPAGHRLHGLRWHDLRHTAASLSLAATPNLHIVKERLGHEDIRTTINTYGHMLPSVDAALADALGAMWDATATPPDSNVFELQQDGEA